jgi:hypothetical protein
MKSMYIKVSYGSIDLQKNHPYAFSVLFQKLRVEIVSRYGRGLKLR